MEMEMESAGLDRVSEWRERYFFGVCGGASLVLLNLKEPDDGCPVDDDGL